MNRVLVKYAKNGEASLLSHRETMRSLERALRRSGLPMAYTSGYNPRPRMSFSPALPLGVAAEAEYLEVALDGDADVSAAREVMNASLPRGLSITDIQELPATMPKLSKWTLQGLYRVPGEGGDTYLLLSLTGKKQGRLKDALEAISRAPGDEEQRSLKGVSRIGLYASEEEVFEDAGETVYYFDGESRELVTIKGDDEERAEPG